MKESVLRKEYMVKPSESDAQQQLPLTLLISQMIDLATDHANFLDIGFLNLESRNLGWVLLRVSVEMARWPKTGEKYTLSTWVENFNSHFSERCFSVVSQNGEILGFIRTVWVIIDLDTHKSVGTAGLQLPPELIAGLDCPIPRQVKHRHFEPEKETEYIFKYTDLDFYRHVNTVRYIALLINQYRLEDFDRNVLSRFDVAFSTEGKYGETALIKSIEEEIETPGMIKEKNVPSQKRTFEISVGSRIILTASLVLTPKD